MNRRNMSNDAGTEDLRTFLDTLGSPALLMQAEPRQVVTGNRKACELFDKDISQLEGHRGGQVFDCVHAFTEKGCGKDENCEDCKIKNAVVETFASGKTHDRVQTTLKIRKQNETVPYIIRVETEKRRDFVVITIDEFEKEN